MRIDHLPFPMPQRPHSFIQKWRHLSLLHWEVDPAQLISYIPDGLEVDLFENKAYVSIIPFMMVGVRPRLAVSIPGISTFPEFNIRTYVKQGGKAGGVFYHSGCTKQSDLYVCTICLWSPISICKG